MSSSFFATIGVEYVDHVAVTTATLETTLRDYLGLPGTKLLRGPGVNESQRVRYAFVRLAEGTTVEILAPLPDSPIAGHLQRGGGAYHFCFAVPNLADSTSRALAHGARLLVDAKADPAFDGRRVAFLHHPAHGLLELVESVPNALASPVASTATAHQPFVTSIAISDDGREARLREVFRGILPHLNENEVATATFGQTAGWDSLTHIQLISQVETDFGVSVPAETFGALTSFDRFLELVRK